MTVYLIHLERKIAGIARHYIGKTENLEQRIADHRRGRGARLLQVAKQRRIPWRVARVWRGVARDFERQLKNGGHYGERHCPVCSGPNVHRRR